MDEARFLELLDRALTPVREDIRGLRSEVATLHAKVAALDAKVAALDAKVAALDAKVAALDAKVDRLSHAHHIEAMRASNGRKGMTERLEPVPVIRHGHLLTPPVFPKTLQHLVVGGSELAPDTNTRSMWNIAKSRELIQFYDEGYESEFEGRDDAESSRQKRLRVARLIGVTAGQMSLVAQASFA